jgi:NitT/TauT family transport system substrate-binding protein
MVALAGGFGHHYPEDEREYAMLTRRLVLKAGMAALAGSPLAVPLARGEGKGPIKVRYTEVVHSILFTPAYAAMANGYFAERGLDVAMTTAQGGDKAIAALLGGGADIALIGPEVAIFVLNSDSPTKVRMFCGATATDGYMLMGRDKVEAFQWNMLRGKEVLGWRPGSTPLLYLEAALRKNGLDPQTDLKLENNIAIPARRGAWLAGQAQYAIFAEPDASQLEQEGNAHFVASIGQTVGFVDYTTFMATDQYLRDNPAVVRAWTGAIAKAETWLLQAKTAEIVKLLEPYFPGINATAMTAGVERYRRLGIWKSSPAIEPAAMDRFQDILVAGRVLDSTKRVKFADIVRSDFAAAN